jgi:hypothetical protein
MQDPQPVTLSDGEGVTVSDGGEVTQGDITPGDGPAGRSMRALIDSMGALRPWERVTAESAFALARALDVEEDGAKVATLSRELRQVVATLARIGEAAAPAPRVVEEAPDPIALLADEVARKRASKGRPA